MEANDKKHKIIFANIIALLFMVIIGMSCVTLLIMVYGKLFYGYSDLQALNDAKVLELYEALPLVVVGLTIGKIAGKRLWVFTMHKTKLVSDSYIKNAITNRPT